MGKQWKQCQTLFSWAPKSLQMVVAAMKLRHLFFGRKAINNLDSLLKTRDITSKGLYSQSYSFSSSHVWMWKLDHKESWALKNWCFWTVVLEKTLESHLDSKEIQLIHPKGNQSWIFIGRTDAEAETPVFWPPVGQSWLTGKRPWCWERLKAGREGGDGGWDGWMASPTRWTWVWVSFRSWWWTGKPGVLQSMGLQRVGHDRVTELTEKLKYGSKHCVCFRYTAKWFSYLFQIFFHYRLL